MNLKIQFFGMIAELVGKEQLELNAFQGSALDEVEAYLLQEFPDLSKMTYTMSLNRQVVDKGTELTEQSEIALLPPFAGG
jgi:molybdopterin converting factor small subunit